MPRSREMKTSKVGKRGPPQQFLSGDSNPQTVKEHNSSRLSNRIIDEGRKRWKDKYGENIRPTAHRKTRQKRRVVTALPEETVTASVIAQFKTTPMVTAESLITTRPFMGQCCNCLPNSQKDFITSSTTTEGIKDICNVRNEIRGNSFAERHFETVVYALRKRMFKHYADVSLATLTSPRVVEAVQQQKQLLEAESENVSLLQKIEKKPEKILDAMKASISNHLVRFTGWFLLKCLPLFLQSVQVHKGEIEMIKKAHERGLPLIYLPLHRSHLDYILITFILCMQDMKAPYVAAGDNLNIPLFRKLDRQKGQKDFIYRAVLHSYMQELLKCGDSLEFFIEGGRSRSGKTYTPKAGLLSIVVETLMEGLVEDVYIVPVSISYERILDGNFNSEQLEYMQVNQPISSSPANSDNASDQENSSDETQQLADVLPLRSSSSCSSLYGTDVVVEEQRQLIKKLAEHLVSTAQL
ncbi:hypothetical protein KUTeg_004765 [Tegillarca granosa]|uniref:Phospholipid/glycerol acyltransferase domain-containing protein n=1 Tax=Tegillarca granosa TaxID=220873 RepID=A0ABQ9FJN8_TEGGR|nr:hypothetical protein KUTeg_004765 [Tegillarca granosa]